MFTQYIIYYLFTISDIWPHVSRLEAVKKAALHQIKQIRDETPNVRVGLVTFGTEVITITLHIDGLL